MSSSSETYVAAEAMVFPPPCPNVGAPSRCLCFCNHNSLKKAWLARLARVWHAPLSLALLQTNPYELLYEVLCRQNGMIRFKGPWFSSLFGVITCNPRNLEYLLKTKFSNFLKGPYF
ncbi:hypothetical protein EV1_039392 [Malus domestica]